MGLEAELAGIVGREQVLSRPIDRIAYANDASVYRLVPRAVVRPRDIEEVRGLLRLSRLRGIPLTFRAAGTSLSGQAVTDGILVDVSHHWREIRVEHDGRAVRVQPGAIGGAVNRVLAPHGMKIGPDPASIDSCMLGGILANNSSGMCCGVSRNAYHTLAAMRFVLPDGTVVNTESATADERLGQTCPSLVGGLLELRDRVRADSRLCGRIRQKYRLKNTMGYSLNAFMDHAAPVELLAHLMIGSEGTLGFIAEAVLRTIPEPPLKYTGLLFFDDVPSACVAIEPLRATGAEALELMDRASLRAIERQPGVPPRIRSLSPDAAAVLVEYACADEAALELRRAACEELLPRLPLAAAASFTEDPERRAALWRVRKGLIPSVGSMRARGTSFIIEDVVFPPERLAQGVAQLQELFTRHAYDEAIVFGHARDGNLHFVLTQAFDDARDVRRYDAFMHELAELVAVRHGGALKAEHGTGRNMAPFVETEWGGAAYAVMRDLKRLIDPRNLLNPGVILNDDPRAHVTHLKSLPPVEAEIDGCIECGFCERVCPSRDLTLTPRRRIVVLREMSRLRREEPRSPVLREIERDFRYAGIDTCAADGMCATACPVSIDTGHMIKRLRGAGRPAAAHELARVAVSHFSLLERAARTGLRVARGAAGLPGAAPAWHAAAAAGPADAVLFRSCVTRVAGEPPPAPGAGTATDAAVRVAARAGVALRVPEDAEGLCCGLPFSSRGLDTAARDAAERTLAALWSWSERGRLPVVIDQSPCTWALLEAARVLVPRRRERMERLQVLDGIELAHDILLPRLAPRPLPGAVALHPVCSARKLGLEGKLRGLAARCAAQVDVPPSAGCCGVAGDRGFRFPELPRAALGREAAELREREYLGYYSSSRSCEIGISRVTGATFRSFWWLLEETTREIETPPGHGAPGDHGPVRGGGRGVRPRGAGAPGTR